VQVPLVALPTPKPTKANATRGTRLPEDYAPSLATTAALKAEGFAEPLTSLPSFKDFWRAKPGAGGTKLDWDATYRNWVRRDAAQAPARNQGHRWPVQRTPASGPTYKLACDTEEAFPEVEVKNGLF
jgi:hypothetical protein